MEDNKDREKLYELLSQENVELPEKEQFFDDLINDPDCRKWAYQTLVDKGYDNIDEQKFYRAMSEQTVHGSGSVPTASSLVKDAHEVSRNGQRVEVPSQGNGTPKAPTPQSSIPLWNNYTPAPMMGANRNAATAAANVGKPNVAPADTSRNNPVANMRQQQYNDSLPVSPAALSAQNARTEEQQKAFDERTRDFRKQMDANLGNLDALQRRDAAMVGRTIEAAKNPFNTQKVVQMNPATGHFEEGYVTKAGNVVGTEEELAQENRAVDAAFDPEGIVSKELESAYAERDRLNEAYEERVAEISKSYTPNNSIFRSFDNGRGISYEGAYAEISKDPEARMLLTAKRKAEERIKILEKEKNQYGFMNVLWNTLTSLDTWDFGLSDLADARNMMQYGNKDLSGKEKEARDAMMRNAYETQSATQEYGENDTFWQRAGELTANAIPFVVEFALTGGGFGAATEIGTRIGTKAVTKLGLEAAERFTKNGVKKWVVRNSGVLAGDFVASIAMANTTGAANTWADILSRHNGEIVLDKDGNPVFSGGKSWGESIYEGEMASTLEYYTEKLGSHLEIEKGLEKLGLGKLSAALNRIKGSEWNKMLGKVGVNELPGEAIEEEANIILNSLLVGDNKFSDLFDQKTQADIWGGMMLSIGFMKSPAIVQGVAKPVVDRALYHRYEKAVNNAGSVASFRLTEERWEPIREKIDNTTNQDMKDVVWDILNDGNLNNIEKKAIMDYVENLMKLRGFNLRTMADAKDMADNAAADTDEDKAVRDQENSIADAYSEGYNADDEEGKEIMIAHAVDNTSERAKAAYDGLMQKIKDEIEHDFAVKSAALDAHTHEDGNVYTLAMKESDENDEPKVRFLKKGNVQMLEDGSGIDRANSDNVVYVFNPETNKTESIDPSADTGIAFVVSKNSKESVLDGYKQESESALQARIDELSNKVTVQPGQQTKTNDGTDAVVISVNGDDVLLKRADGKEENVSLSDMQRILDEALIADYEANHADDLLNNTIEQYAEEFVEGVPDKYEPGMRLTVKREDGSETEAEVMGVGRWDKNANGKFSFVPDENGSIVEYKADGEVAHLSIAAMPNFVTGYKEKAAPAAPAATVAPAEVETTAEPVETAPEEMQSDESSEVDNDAKGSDMPAGETAEEVRLSNEVDDNGRQFVLNSKGDIFFGKIDKNSGLADVPILLSEGMITDKATNAGYGLVHIEARHGEQIRKAGYKSVIDFVEKVADGYEDIRKGKDRDGNQTYLLQLTDKHNNTLIVELSHDGSYWNVTTAGIFNKKYASGKKLVYSRHTQTNQTAETGEGSLDAEQNGTQTKTSTMPSTSSGKGTEISETDKKNVANNSVSAAESDYEGALKKYGEKAAHKISTTVADREKVLGEKSAALAKAQQEYDDAPIGKEDKAEKKLEKARAEYDAAKADLDRWNEVKKLSDRAELESSNVDDLVKAEEERIRTESEKRSTYVEKAGNASEMVIRAKKTYGDYFDSDFGHAYDVNEVVSLGMPNAKLRWDSDANGAIGLDRATGLKRSDFQKFNSMIAKKGEGMPFNDFVHSIYESEANMDNEGNPRFQDDEIRDALIGMLMSYEKPNDIKYYHVYNRIKIAEDAISADDGRYLEAFRNEKQEEINAAKLCEMQRKEAAEWAQYRDLVAADFAEIPEEEYFGYNRAIIDDYLQEELENEAADSYLKELAENDIDNNKNIEENADRRTEETDASRRGQVDGRVDASGDQEGSQTDETRNQKEDERAVSSLERGARGAISGRAVEGEDGGVQEQKAGNGVRKATEEQKLVVDGIVGILTNAGMGVYADTEVGQRILDDAKGGVQMNAAESMRRKKREEELSVKAKAISLVTGKPEKEVRKKLLEAEEQRRRDAKEVYDIILSGEYNDVSLQKINDFINNATPRSEYGRRVSERLPQRVERKMLEGKRGDEVEALFTRASESSIPANERAREATRGGIAEAKKSLLEKWAKASGHWHTELSDFTDETEPLDSGHDSDVYMSKDGTHVIKLSRGKNDKRFKSDPDAVTLFNYVFPNSAYRVLGYGDFGKGFVRILEQPYVDFANSTPLSVDERVEYMRNLGFKPINKECTAFSNGELLVADLQKSNIVRSNEGNIRVIDADVKLHTKDVGGNYTYLPVEHDLPNGDGLQQMKAWHGSAAVFDAFDSSHFLEGEGSMVYGAGHYVTDVEGTGRMYANVARVANRKVGSTPMERAVNSIMGQYVYNSQADSFEKAKEVAIRNAKSEIERNNGMLDGTVDVGTPIEGETKRFVEESLKNAEEELAVLNGLTEDVFLSEGEKSGLLRQLYEVEIPDDNGNNYIDWNANDSETLKSIADKLPYADIQKYGIDRGIIKSFEGLYNDVVKRSGSPTKASAIFADAGFVGIKVPTGNRSGGDGRGMNYVIFNDSDLKIQNRISFHKADNSSSVFYSNAYRAVEGIKQEKATPEQWLAMLQKNGGLKVGEDKWLGLSEWLKGQDKKSLTKQEVLDYIAQNKIEIVEVKYGEGELYFDYDYEDGLYHLEGHPEWTYKNVGGYKYIAYLNGKFSFEAYSERVVRSLIQDKIGADKTINDTRLEYTTEGLENKREIALVVPNIEPYNEHDEVHFGDAGNGRAVAWVRFGEASTIGSTKSSDAATSKRLESARKAFNNYDAQLKKKYDAPSASMEDFEKLVLAMTPEENAEWSRLSREVDAIEENILSKSKKRVLVIDEIQSKRHQDGREKGYEGDDQDPALKAELNEIISDWKTADYFLKKFHEDMGRRWLLTSSWTDEEKEKFAQIRADYEKAEKRRTDFLMKHREFNTAYKKGDSVPDAPFRKNWHELAMKRMLRFAAENGYAKVAWTTGAQQAERYNLGHVVDEIWKQDDRTVYGKRVYPYNLNKDGYSRGTILVDSETGNVVEGRGAFEQISEGTPLSQVVGKELADRMLALESNNKIDLNNEVIGGEGMKGFYDQMLPKFVDKYGKKFGAKTGDVELDLPNERDRVMHSVDVTPEMKESVMDGQPMFFKTEEGDVYGFTLDGKIYIDPDIATAETPIHEYTHLWAAALRKASPKAWAQLKKALTKEQDVMDYVKRKYPELAGNDDALMDEVFAHYSGRRGNERIEAEMKEEMAKADGVFDKAKVATIFGKIKAALNIFWNMARDLFAGSVKGLNKMKAEDFADMAVNDMLNGFNPNTNDGVDAAGQKTLMGVHNISEDKLRKAIKNGGFANPSVAVVDTRKGVHDSYGDISLIPTSSLMLEKRLGRNAGTWMADAWTPTYPAVNVLPGKGTDKVRKEIMQEWAANEPDEAIREELKKNLGYFVDGSNRGSERLQYQFLKEKGMQPEVYEKTNDYDKEFFSFLKNLSEETGVPITELCFSEHGEKVGEYYGKRLAETVFAKDKDKKVSDDIRQRITQDFVGKWKNNLGRLDGIVYDVYKLSKRPEKETDADKTFVEASFKVNTDSQLRKEYDQWLAALDERLGMEEKLFAGYTPSGYRRYVANTVENASKLMNKGGQAGNIGLSSVGAFIAKISEQANTLEKMRKNKDKLIGKDQGFLHDDASHHVMDEFFDLSQILNQGSDEFGSVGEARLNEIAGMKGDIRGYLKREYGVDVSDEWMQRYNDLVDYIRKNYPVFYFETKFNRPVALSEFGYAVVPEGTDEDVVHALQRAGVEVSFYNKDVEGDRERVVNEVADKNDGIKFHKADDSDLSDEHVKSVVKEINDGKVVKAYRAMQLVDGKLYPPMAAVVEGEYVEPTEPGDLQIADERPDLVKNGKFKLNKGNGSSVDAAYNPYFHTSRSPLNDQFSSAWNRPNLVTVEVEIPESELTSGYKAEGAKDAVGETEWKSGPVSGVLAKEGNPRKVILSRYCKVNRVLDDREVAERIAEMLAGSKVEGIPFNTVSPSLRDALVDAGVDIVEPQKGNAGDAARGAYEDWKNNTNDSDKVRQEVEAFLKPDMFSIPEKIRRDMHEGANKEIDALGVEDMGDVERSERAIEKGLSGAFYTYYDGMNMLEHDNVPEVVRDAFAGAEYKHEDIPAELDRMRKEQQEEIESYSKEDIEQDELSRRYYIEAKEKISEIEKGQAWYDENKGKLVMAPVEFFDDEGRYVGPSALNEVYYTNEIKGDSLQTRAGAETDELPRGTSLYNADAKGRGSDLSNATQNDPIRTRAELGAALKSTAKLRNNLGVAEKNLSEQKRDAVSDAGKQLNTKVNIVENVDDISGTNAERKRKAKGWFDINTGEITVVLPNCTSVEDAIATVGHETIGHKGMRELLGENYDAFLDEVYDHLNGEMKRRVDEKVNGRFLNDMKGGIDKKRRVAVDELFAEMAEKPFEEFTAEEQTFWQKLKATVLKWLDKLLGGGKLPTWFEIGDNEIRYMLWRSKENLERGREGIIEKARDIVKREELGIDGELFSQPARKSKAEREVNKLTKEDLAVLNHAAMRINSEAMAKGEEIQDELRIFTANHYVVVKNNELGNISPIRAYNIEKSASEIWDDIRRNVRYEGNQISDSSRRILDEARSRLKGGMLDTGDTGRRGTGNGDAGVGGRQQSYRDSDNTLDSGAHLDGDIYSNNFKRWFGDWENDPENASKVVDENGRPMVMYHGSGTKAADFDVFIMNNGSMGSGAYFSSSYEEAADYAKSALAGKKGFPEDVDDISDEDVEEYVGEYYLNVRDSKQITHSRFDRNAIEVVARNPRDIKSATYNNGDFDPDNDGLRFRDVDDMTDRILARDSYEEMMSSSMNQFTESMQDSMLSLKKFYESILGKDKRIEDVADYENAYMFENRMTSKSNAEINVFHDDYIKPIVKAVYALTKGNKKAYDELTDYLMAKHGLERNRVFAERDASRMTDEKYRDAIANAQREADKDPLDDDRQDALDAIVHESKEYKEDQYYEMRTKDYSGLTALTGKENVADAELEAEQMVGSYESNHDTKDLWTAINNATKESLKKTYVSGLMSFERYKQVRDMFDFYIPLQGFDETIAEEKYAYLGSDGTLGYGTPIRSAKGRKSKADDPLATIAMNGEAAIRQGNRNVMKQRFMNFVNSHPSDLVSVKDVWLKYNSATQQWEQYFDADLKETDSPEEIERKTNEFEKKMEKLKAQNPSEYNRSKDLPNVPFRVVDASDMKQHQVLVRRDGRSYLLTINGNPRVTQAINGLTNPNVYAETVFGKAVNIMGDVNRFLSSVYTTRNPEFVVSNFLRDAIYSNCMTWVKEDRNYAMKYSKNFGKMNPAFMLVMYTEWKNGKLREKNIENRMSGNKLSEVDQLRAYFEEFMLNGGETGWTNLKDIEKHKQDLERELKREGNVSKKAWKALGGCFDMLNSSVENCARFAAYVTSREMSRSVGRSVWDAKEVSVNFNKKGAGDKFLSSKNQKWFGKIGSVLSGAGRGLYVFWNASLQGLNAVGKAMKRNPWKATGLLTSLFALGSTAGILSALIGGDDDDEYYNLPEYIRRSNICFRWSKDMPWITIPLPVDFRAVYGLGELSAGVVLGKEKYRNRELTKQYISQLSQLMPIDFMEGGGGLHAFVPSVIKPMVEAEKNKSWSGLPIYRDNTFTPYKPEWTRAYKSANSTIVGATKWLNEATGGDDVKKGLIDLNPAKIEYLMKGYLGGPFTMYDRLHKTAETVLGERDFEWRNIPMASRVLHEGDERTHDRKITNRYFDLVDEYEKTKYTLKGYKKIVDNGHGDVVKYAKKITFLEYSDEYARYLVMDHYKPLLDKLHDLSKEASDEEKASFEEYQNMLRRECVELADSFDGENKIVVENRLISSLDRVARDQNANKKLKKTAQREIKEIKADMNKSQDKE